MTGLLCLAIRALSGVIWNSKRQSEYFLQMTTPWYAGAYAGCWKRLPISSL